MRSLRARLAVLGLVGAVMLACGALAASAGSTGAEPPATAKPAVAGKTPLGSVTALAWRVHTPVGARLVLAPHVSFKLEKRALRVLRATKPRLSGSFAVKIVTVPARGHGRTLVAVSRHARGAALSTSTSHSLLGRTLRLKKWVLSAKQTATVKRAAKQHALAIAISARYRVRYTNVRGRTVVTPMRSRSIALPIRLKRPTATGGNLRKAAATYRQMLTRVAQLKTACVTRNTILRQLRSTYNTLISGNRTGAAAMLLVWIRDAEAMRDAGLLSSQQASTLGSELGALLKRVGIGRSKRVEHARRWSSLADCGAVSSLGTDGPQAAQVRGHRSLAAALVAIRRVVKRVRKALVRNLARALEANRLSPESTERKLAKLAGMGVQQLIQAVWPEDESEPTVTAQVPAGDPTGAQPVLDDLKVQMKSFSSWEECCLATSPDYVGSLWNTTLSNFTRNRWRFQPATPAYSFSDQLELLPLQSEYMNMYLTMLHDGVVNGPRWGALPETILSFEDAIRAELNANDPNSAMGYSKRIYDAGLAQEGTSTDPQTNFSKNNDYKREMQLQVLDFRDIWYLQDPMAYPYGDPTFKKDRIIYSDAIGTTTQPFSAPANPSSPLSALTTWTTRVTTGSHTNQNWLAAVQADNSPQVGAPTGAAGGTATTYTVAPGTTPGPIVQVDATWDQKSSSSAKVIGTVRFGFSDGTTAAPGGDFYDRGATGTTSWAFEDEVLAAAKIMGSYPMTSSIGVGDSAVFGFRLADSFASAWKGSLPGAVRAPNAQVCLSVAPVAITSGPHSGTLTGSRADGAAVLLRACDGAWDQTWLYEDYNDPNSTGDDAFQRDLDVYAGTMCTAPKDGATTAGTPVQVYYCDGTSAQDWTRNTDGTITNDQSRLCLERAGVTAILNACNGGAAQKWVWS